MTEASGERGWIQTGGLHDTVSFAESLSINYERVTLGTLL